MISLFKLFIPKLSSKLFISLDVGNIQKVGYICDTENISINPHLEKYL